MRFFFLLWLPISLIAVDFDCILIGSSPFSLFEALYQAHRGKKVLILEESSQCGGAWKGVDVCGITQADLGCHHIGSDLKLKKFLEEYAGCTIVSLDHPLSPFDSHKSPNGWYFSQGCHELIDRLLALICNTDIVVLTNQKAESAWIDKTENIAIVRTQDKTFSASKLIVTPTTSLNLQPGTCNQPLKTNRYFHLYLLIQDPTQPRFSYKSGGVPGTSRLMNLTYFVGLAGTGRQLIVVQTHKEQNVEHGQSILESMKKANLVDIGAYLLQAEHYIYETGTFNQNIIAEIGAEEIVEVLQTSHFQSLLNHIPKWEKSLPKLSFE